MKLGVRGQLFATSVAVIVVALIASGLYLRSELRSRLDKTISSELETSAKASREALTQFRQTDIITMDAVADRLGEATSSRITIIAKDGHVLGDSALTVAEVRDVENHRARPEIRQAYAQDSGSSHRHSATLNSKMRYLAVRLPSGGVVRAARSTREIDAAVSRLGWLLLAGGFVGILIAVLMSWLASHLLSSQLRNLVITARSMLREDTERPETTNEIGSIEGTLNQMSDELQRTLSSLAAERSRLEAVLEGMEEAVVSLDQSSRIEFVNARALTLLDLAQSPTGATMIETLREPALQEITAAALGGSAAVAEFVLPNTTIRVQATATPQRGGRGCSIVFHDVTEVRRLETVRRDFVANVSHELRTPVSVMRANAETLINAQGEDPEHTQPFLEAIMRHADRMARIISDLLDLSRLEAGRRELDRTAVSILAGGRRAQETVSEAAHAKSISINCTAEADVCVDADRGALDQILVNLIDNAIKYSPAGSTITVAAKHDDQHVRISVSDEGPGVPEEHRSRVFERFYRVDAGRSRDLGGTGLGLAIVKHLTEAMGGKLGLEASEAGGAEFWVSLPLSSETSES